MYIIRKLTEIRMLLEPRLPMFIPSFFPGLSGYRTGRGGYIAVGNTSRKNFWEPSACAQPQLMRKGDIEES